MAMSERRTLPIGEAIGTLAVMFAMVLIEAGDAVRLLSKSESCLRQIFSMVGTPNMIDVLGDFSHENQITKAWYRSDQSKHPHAFREDVPRRRTHQFDRRVRRTQNGNVTSFP